MKLFLQEMDTYNTEMNFSCKLYMGTQCLCLGIYKHVSLFNSYLSYHSGVMYFKNEVELARFCLTVDRYIFAALIDNVLGLINSPELKVHNVS